MIGGMETKSTTALESQVIAAIKTGDDWDGSPAMHFDDIVECTKIPAKKLRGVVSSLDQKGIIMEQELPTCMVWQIL